MPNPDVAQILLPVHTFIFFLDISGIFFYLFFVILTCSFNMKMYESNTTSTCRHDAVLTGVC